MPALTVLAPALSRLALAAGGGALVKALTRSALDGAAFVAGAELAGQIADWARSVDGTWDSTVGGPDRGIGGCSLIANGYGNLEYSGPGGQGWVDTTVGNIAEIVSVAAPVSYNVSADLWSVTASIRSNGSSTPFNASYIFEGESVANAVLFRINPVVGTCSQDEDIPNSLPPIDLGPVSAGDCTINATFHGFIASPSGVGNVEPVFEITPANLLRNSGGIVVGECNFQPTVLVGGGGDGTKPPTAIPNPGWPTSSDPWWEYIAEGITGAVIEDIYSSIKEALFEQLPPASFTLVAPCNKDDQGDPDTFTVEFPQQPYQERIEAWQIASAELLQQQLNWKTPICRDHPALLGDWVTVRFESIENSPEGTRPLRKLFRYRSQSALDLGQIAAYWESFTWNAGPVCVQHKGASWGTPQCWAANADEGKRVIRFAGLEAGIDPDVVGEFVISGSSDPRFGMPGTMQVAQVQGLDWITSRQGPSGPPLLTVDP